MSIRVYPIKIDYDRELFNLTWDDCMRDFILDYFNDCISVGGTGYFCIAPEDLKEFELWLSENRKRYSEEQIKRAEEILKELRKELKGKSHISVVCF